MLSILIVPNLIISAYLFASCFMKQEDRLVVTLPFGLLIATCLYGYAITLNRYLVDWFWALMLANLELFILSFGLAWFHLPTLRQFRPRLGFKFNQSGLDRVCLISLVLVILGVLVGQGWNNRVILRASGGATEANLWHGGIIATMARGAFPPVNPLEPDYLLNYRWTYHSQVAALNNLLGGDVIVSAGVFNLWFILLLFGGTIALLYRYKHNLGQALGGGAVLLLASTASWLVDGSEEASFWSQLIPLSTTHRNFINAASIFDMQEINISIAFGYFVFLATFWFWLEWETGGFRKSGFFIFAVLLAYLNASHEVLIIAFGVAISSYWLTRSLSEHYFQYKPLLITTAAGIVGLGLSLPFGTLLLNYLIQTTPTRNFRIVLNTQHFGFLPTIPNDTVWIPLFSSRFMLYSGFLALLLPLVLINVWITRSKLSPSPLFQILLITGLIAFIASISFYPEAAPGDQYRFTQVWYTLWALTVYLGIVRLIPISSLILGRLWQVVLWIVIVLWIMPTLVVAFTDTVSLKITSNCVSLADEQAARYFQKLPWSEASRMVALNGVPDWRSLYNCSPQSSMNIALVAYGGMSLPIGHSVYDHPQQYLPTYTKAITELDSAALSELKVDYIYVNTENIYPNQSNTLANLLSQNLIQEVYSQNNRIIYKFKDSAGKQKGVGGNS